MRVNRMVMILSLFAVSVLPLFAAPPAVINYQGRIQVQGTNFTGTGFFKFALGTENMGTVYWSNDGTLAGEPAAAVQGDLDKGLYSIGLGDTTLAGMGALDPAVLANTGLWLRVWFSDGILGFEQLVPDKPLASVPYALVAGSIAGLSGFSVTDMDDVTDAGSGMIITDTERSQIAANGTDISTVSNSLSQRIAQNESGIADLTTGLATEVVARVSADAALAGNIASASNALDARITQNETDIASNLSSIASVEYQVSSLETGKVSKTGDTMTGALNINAASAGGDLVIGTTGTAVTIGRSANGTGNGAAVGRNANGAGYGAGMGYFSDGSDNGAGIGYSAKGGWYGAAIGSLANGSIYGAAVGRSANGFGGSAVGFGANGSVYGAALGQDSRAANGGVAVGFGANGAGTNIAIGVAASASGTDRIAIGRNITNSVNNSAAVRGTLYLDGGTGVYYRSTFGSGAWSDIRSGMATGTPVYAETDPVWVAEKAGYATGTPLYAYTETDPVYVSEKPGLATGTPVYVETDPGYTSERSGLATGSPVYVESDPVWTAEKAGYATGTPLYAYAETDPVYASEKSGLATGTPVYAETDPVWSSEKSGYATGTPLYVFTETDPVYAADKTSLATGSPVYVESDPVWAAEKTGYATGTPLYAYTEADPVYASEKSGLATGTPVYAESDPEWASEKSGYATGTPLYAYTEADPVWSGEKAGYATGTPLYAYTETDPIYTSEKSGLATGTPVYAESDPLWTAEKSGYATGTPLYAYTETDPVWLSERAGYATGTPLYVETEPSWTAASNSIQQQIGSNGLDIASNLSDITNNEFQISSVQSQVSSINTSKVSKTGDTMTGALNLPVNGLVVGITQLVVKAGMVGINQPNPLSSLHVGQGRAVDTDPLNGGIIRIGSMETIEDAGGYELACDASFIPKVDDWYDCGSFSKSWSSVYCYMLTEWSDERLKESIADMDYGLDDIMKLRPVSYLKKNRHDQTRSLGLVAQEVEPVISEVVETHKWKRSGEDNKGKFERVTAPRIGINYTRLIPVLIRGIQELKTDQDAIRREIVTVEGGSLELNTREMRVPFTSSFTNSLPKGKLPIVTITPCSPEASIYIAEISASGFTVRSNVPITDEVMFTWIAIVPSGQNQRLQ